MRPLFHHQPEAQHPNFQLSTSWQARLPHLLAIAAVRGTTNHGRCWKVERTCRRHRKTDAIDPLRSYGASKSRNAAVPRCAIAFVQAREVLGSETPQFHHTARRHSVRVAARGTRPAPGVTGDRVSQPPIARGYVPPDSGIPAWLGGKRLHRRSERRYRISLRNWRSRQIAEGSA